MNWKIEIDGERLTIKDADGKLRHSCSVGRPQEEVLKTLASHFAFSMRREDTLAVIAKRALENERRLLDIAEQSLEILEEFDPEEEHWPKLIGSIRTILEIGDSRERENRLESVGPSSGNDARQ